MFSKTVVIAMLKFWSLGLLLALAPGMLRPTPRAHARARPALASALDELRGAVDRVSTEAKQAVGVFLPLVAFAAGTFIGSGAIPELPRAPTAIVVDATALMEARVPMWDPGLEAATKAHAVEAAKVVMAQVAAPAAAVAEAATPWPSAFAMAPKVLGFLLPQLPYTTADYSALLLRVCPRGTRQRESLAPDGSANPTP